MGKKYLYSGCSSGPTIIVTGTLFRTITKMVHGQWNIVNCGVRTTILVQPITYHKHANRSTVNVTTIPRCLFLTQRACLSPTIWSCYYYGTMCIANEFETLPLFTITERWNRAASKRDVGFRGHYAKHEPVFFSSVTSSEKRQELAFLRGYRRLNKHTVKNKFPLPIVDELLDELASTNFFSKLPSLGLPSNPYARRWWGEDNL